jgi:hypothetical protein
VKITHFNFGLVFIYPNSVVSYSTPAHTLAYNLINKYVGNSDIFEILSEICGGALHGQTWRIINAVGEAYFAIKHISAMLKRSKGRQTLVLVNEQYLIFINNICISIEIQVN